MSDLPAPFPPEPPALSELSRIAHLLGVMVAVLAVACLYLARAVLIPLTLAVLLSFLLAPLVRLLRVLRLGRTLSAIAAALIGLGLVLALAGLIGAQIAGLASNVPRYQTTVEHKVAAVRAGVLDRLAEVSHRFAIVPPPPPAPPAARPGAAPKPVLKAPPVEAPKAATSSQLGVAFQLAERVLLPIASPLGTAAIVFVVAIFILLQREDLRDRLIRVFGSGDLHRTTLAIDDAGRRLSRYFLAQLAVNAGFGATIGLGLAVIDVPSPVLWGTLGMLMRFVPYIGTPLAALLPIALAVAVAPGWGMALWTVALFVTVELLASQAVEPFLYARSTGLSPFAVVVAAVFWTWAWGPIGLILSTPLTVCLVVLGRYVKRLEFLDVLLGNRPALSPVESFYQRLLAGDPDEAQDHAELLLRDRSLAEYYDEVAVKGLQLATADAARGVLRPAHLERIRAAIGEMLGELDAPAGAGAPPAENMPAENMPAEDIPVEDGPAEGGRGGAAGPAAPVVLCIAGRGPLDGIAVEMLAQLLRQAGLNPRVLPHTAAARARIAALDPHEVAVVVLCYLDLSVAPAHLRFLLRRLRERVPGRPIVVGLFPDEAPPAEVARLLAAVGAARPASSLSGLVEACRELAAPAAGAPASPAAAQAAE